MAIFGHLADLPFPEIFNMLGRRTGRLDIRGTADAHDVSLHLHDGALRGLVVDGARIDDPLLVRDRLGALMDASAGVFEFHRCSRDELSDELALAMPQLLLSIASAVDEISAYRERFPHPRTRFREAAAGEIWLDDGLYDFFERAKPLLAVGADAEELAHALDLGIDQVQLHLYKLRSVGRIAPVRAAEPMPTTEPDGAGTSWHEHAGGIPLIKPLDATEVPPRIARDHLFEDTVSSRTGTSRTGTSRTGTSQTSAPTRTAEHAPAQRARPAARGLFRRLLDAFRQQAGAVA